MNKEIYWASNTLDLWWSEWEEGSKAKERDGWRRAAAEALMAWAAREEEEDDDDDEYEDDEGGEAFPFPWSEESLTTSSSNEYGEWNSSLKVEDLDIACLLLYAMLFNFL